MTRPTSRHFPIQHTDAEWRDRLTPEAYHVLRKHGTERAGTSALDEETRRGTYHCAACRQALFKSDAKFDSHSGWPSFFRALDGAIDTKADHTAMVVRTEVHCSQCGSHLGHMFHDGPAPTGERYSVNGVAMAFTPL